MKERNKRSTWDFSDHVHTVEIFKSEQGNEVRIDHFRNKSGGSCGYVRFVNDEYGMAVFGDFGNWVCNRQFIPSKDGRVCDHYWPEKFRRNSRQVLGKYSPELTDESLVELIREVEREYSEGESKTEILDKLRGLRNYVDCEVEYQYHAFVDNYTDLDYEQIPFEKEGDYQLKVVFDAFDEICRRYELQDQDSSGQG